MSKKGLLFIVLSLISTSLFATSLRIESDVPSRLEKRINTVIEETLDLVLSSQLVIDDDKSDIYNLKVSTKNYDEEKNSLTLNFDNNYNDKNLNFDIIIVESSNNNDLLKNLEEKLLSAYKYDILNLFDPNENLVINYFTPNLASFDFDESTILNDSQYFYIRDKSDDIVGVVNINTLFEKSATLNIISSDRLTANLLLTPGPKGLLSTAFGYDIFNDTILASVGYTFYKSFIPFLTNANLIIEAGGAFGVIDSDSTIYFDTGLSIELPLSLIFSSDSFLKNSAIRATALGGLEFEDELEFNAKYTIGYSIYISNKYNLELYYEKNTIFSTDESSLILGAKVSVLL